MVWYGMGDVEDLHWRFAWTGYMRLFLRICLKLSLADTYVRTHNQMHCMHGGAERDSACRLHFCRAGTRTTCYATYIYILTYIYARMLDCMHAWFGCGCLHSSAAMPSLACLRHYIYVSNGHARTLASYMHTHALRRHACVYVYICVWCVQYDRYACSAYFVCFVSVHIIRTADLQLCRTVDIAYMGCMALMPPYTYDTYVAYHYYFICNNRTRLVWLCSSHSNMLPVCKSLM